MRTFLPVAPFGSSSTLASPKNNSLPGMMGDVEGNARRGVKRKVRLGDSEDNVVESSTQAQRVHEAQSLGDNSIQDLRECNHIISTMDYEFEMEIFRYDQGLLYKFDMNGDKLGIKDQCANCQSDLFSKLVDEMKKSMHMIILRYFKLHRITHLINKEREREFQELMEEMKNEKFADCLYGNLNEASIIIDCIKKIKFEFPAVHQEYSSIMSEIDNEMKLCLKEMINMQQSIKEE